MKPKQFSALIAPLLRHLNVAVPDLAEGQAISVDFQHLQLRLTPLNKHELLVVASLGTLPVNVGGDLPWMLLEANDIDAEGPPICVSLAGRERLLMLWSRERFTLLSPAELINLFERIVAKANSLATLVHAQLQPSAAEPVNRSTQGARRLGGRAPW